MDYKGLGYYVLLLIVPILFHKLLYKYLDLNWGVLLIWGSSYALIVILFTGTISYRASLQYMVNFPILYIGGKYLGSVLTNRRLEEILGLSIIAFSMIAILSVIKDIMENGFMVIGLDRNIPLIGINNKEGYIAATGISTRLLPAISLIGLLMFKIKKNNSYIKDCLVVYGIIALICAIRIQSRTSIVLFGLVLLLGLIRNIKSNNSKKIILSIVILLSIVSICIYLIYNYSEELIILNRFENESNIDGGGRLELLKTVVKLLPIYPIGGMFMNHNVGYAHNFWIDCGRVAGIIPMILLIVITLFYLRNLIKVNRLISYNSLLFLILKFTTIAFFVGFCSEPILEGIPMFCSLFILFWGYINGILLRQSNIKVKALD